MNWTFLVMGFGLLSWEAASAEKRLPPNTWRRVEITWPQVLAREVEDGRWVTTDGYSDNVLRTKTGEVLIRTGIASKSLGTSPGFYTNTTVAWKVAAGKGPRAAGFTFGRNRRYPISPWL